MFKFLFLFFSRANGSVMPSPSTLNTMNLMDLEDNIVNISNATTQKAAAALETSASSSSIGTHEELADLFSEEKGVATIIRTTTSRTISAEEEATTATAIARTVMTLPMATWLTVEKGRGLSVDGMFRRSGDDVIEMELVLHNDTQDKFFSNFAIQFNKNR